MGYTDNYSGIRILTVARLTKEKGISMIPQILIKLLKLNLSIRWYIIGDGEERINLENEIDKYNLHEYLILQGTIMNPYPYMKQCDIYVQPSYHEGYRITIAEAKVFNKIIISTDTIGAKEQIVDGENGIIVKAEIDQLFFAIKDSVQKLTISN